MIKRKLQNDIVSGLVVLFIASTTAYATEDSIVVRAAAPEGAIEHIMVIDLENENYSATFGANSPAVYLNTTLLKQGQLLCHQPCEFGQLSVASFWTRANERDQ